MLYWEDNTKTENEITIKLLNLLPKRKSVLYSPIQIRSALQSNSRPNIIAGANDYQTCS